MIFVIYSFYPCFLVCTCVICLFSRLSCIALLCLSLSFTKVYGNQCNKLCKLNVDLDSLTGSEDFAAS